MIEMQDKGLIARKNGRRNGQFYNNKYKYSDLCIITPQLKKTGVCKKI